jgi:protein-L-isoaspartate(D-aspartate) O-methyltransferase
MIQPKDYSRACQEMIEQINEEMRFSSASTEIYSLSKEVETAFRNVPRHLFIDKPYLELAYENHALPIGQGQTISQPFIVGLMTELLQPKKTDKVLEIGTGSGYQAAILAQLVKEVDTVEVIPELALKAQQLFEELGYKNIHIHIANGEQGWVENALYDGVIVTAASETVPHLLLDQLQPNGRMVIPLGSHSHTQILTLVVKAENGQIIEHPLLPVVFVPFVKGKID